MEEKPGKKEKMAMRGVCANDEKSTAARVWNLYRTKIVGQSTETKTYASAASWHRTNAAAKHWEFDWMKMAGQWFQRQRL